MQQLKLDMVKHRNKCLKGTVVCTWSIAISTGMVGCRRGSSAASSPKQKVRQLPWSPSLGTLTCSKLCSASVLH
jgi:hypothetical protein